MPERHKPPDDITPHEFFTRWVPDAVAADDSRRSRLGDSDATLQFEILGDGGGHYLIEIRSGEVRGSAGRSETCDLHVRVDLLTWRALNRGEISAPEALVRRRVRLEGNLLLAIKLHLILG